MVPKVILERGTFLLSAPDMEDPTFMHTVIMMLDHGDLGAMGVVVNAPEEINVGDLFDGHPVMSKLDDPILRGGPVGSNHLQILHRLPDQTSHGPSRGLPIVGDLRLGGDLDVIGEELLALRRDGLGSTAIARFVLGYAGWGAGQLEHEIAERTWLPLDPASPIQRNELVFFPELRPTLSPVEPSAAPGAVDLRTTLWRRAMAHLGGDGPTLAHLPPDPSWN